MRHEKAVRLIDLARHLAASAEGLTLDEMAAALGVGRRTAERTRDAVREVFPDLEEIADPPTRRFRIPGGLDGVFQVRAPKSSPPCAARPSCSPLRVRRCGPKRCEIWSARS